jgi:Fe-S-cluster containining protein
MAGLPWYKDGLCFECTLCGNCCSGPPGYVWVTKDNIRRIAEYVGEPSGWLPTTHLRRVFFRYSLTERPGGDCVFLRRDGDKAYCQIYPVRPRQCRSWPFWNENLRSRKQWESAGADCPGINRGRRHLLIEIEQQRIARDE